jgi:hypothetical protein
MLSKTKIALSVAMVIGAFGTASVAWAGGGSGKDDGDSLMGGYVNPPSMDGVNPAYHPRWFPGYPGSWNAPTGTGGHVFNPSDSYAYAFYPRARNGYAFAPWATHKRLSRRGPTSIVRGASES